MRRRSRELFARHPGNPILAAGVDTHIHFISPQQAYAALSNGTTTLIGGGTGPSPPALS